MKIACPHCRAAFALDDKRVPAAGLSIKCPKCKQPFAVHRARPEDEGKIIEGKPLGAVPLPGGQRKSSPGADAPPRDDATMVDARPVAPPRDEAVPLPGAAESVREPLPPPPAAPSFELDTEPAPQGSRDEAVPLPGAARDDSAPAQPSYAAIEAASGWTDPDDPFAGTAAPPEIPAPPPGMTDDPFANIDINVPDEAPAGPSLDLDLAASPPPSAPAPAPSAPAASDASVDDPFGLDFPTAPAPAALAPAALNPSSDASLNFDFVDPARTDSAPAPGAASRASGAPGLLDFVDGKPTPKAAPRPGRPPPMIAPTGAAASSDHADTLAADDAAIQAMAAEAPLEEGKKKKPKREKKPKAPSEPLGPRIREALKPAQDALANLKQKPKVIAGGVGVLALLVFIGFGIRATTTSAGFFWKNLWTSSGKQHNAAAREALVHGETLLADGSFSAAREALGTAARTLAALPDDEEARAFFVLCASDLKIGWGATGGDWDQATHVVDKLKEKQRDALRAIGAFALASGDLGKAKGILGPLGDAPNADAESVWLYSEALMRSGEAPHAAQVLDNALKAHPNVKLLLLRGQVERARGKNDEAAKLFEQALAKAPNSGRALVEVADDKLKGGDLAGAGGLLDRALAPEVHSQLDATEDGHASRLRAQLADLQHNGKEAEAQFERAAKLDPNAAETFADYGAFRLKRREYDKAAKQFDLALALDAKNPDTLGNAARAFLGANRYLDADKRIREALDKSPGSARLLYVSGKVAEIIGKLDEAGKEYERALAKKPDLPEALVAEAELALGAADKDRVRDRTTLAEKAPLADKSALDLEGLTDLWLVLGDAATAKADAAAAQALDPEDPYADFAMGKALAAQGDLAAARTLFEKSLARIDGDPVMHYELGSLLRRQGNHAAARKELEKAVALDAKDARFHARLGAVMVEQSEFDTAEAQLKQAVLMDDHSSEGLYFLGRALIAEKKLSEAVETLKKGIEVDPKNGLIDYQLGLAYTAGSQLVQAEDSFTHATEKDPKNADAWEQLGNTLAAQNLYADALVALKKCTLLEPERAPCWAAIGDAQLQLGDQSKAIENLEKSVKLNAGQAPVWAKLGIAFRDRGCDNCKQKAISALQTAAQLAPKDPTAFRELGYIYKDDRKRADAVAMFKRYLELKPDAPDADSVKDDIFYLQEEGKHAP